MRLDVMHLHVLQTMRRLEERFVERVVVEGPLTERQVQRRKELVAERDWNGAVGRIRGSAG